jgi:hypothetical protein
MQSRVFNARHAQKVFNLIAACVIVAVMYCIAVRHRAVMIFPYDAMQPDTLALVVATAQVVSNPAKLLNCFRDNDDRFAAVTHPVAVMNL